MIMNVKAKFLFEWLCKCSQEGHLMVLFDDFSDMNYAIDR